MDFYNNEKELQNRKEEKELVIENKFDEKNNKQLCKRVKQIIQQQINMYFVDIHVSFNCKLHGTY